MILQGVCSTLIGKIGGTPSYGDEEKGEEDNLDIDISIDSYPNNAVEQFVDLIKNKGVSDINDLEWENSGGGGDFGFAEQAFDIALKVVEGKFDLETGNKLEDLAWNDNINAGELADALLNGTDKDIAVALKDVDLNVVKLKDILNLLNIPEDKWKRIKDIAVASKL